MLPSCRFLVAGRVVGDDDKFLTLADLAGGIPDVLKDLFIPVPEFRVDISSTAIRNAGAPPAAGRPS